MTKDEALNQLREVHAIQGRDGCWDIDDYMLGLYNGLELALSIAENRACKYKQRPKSQPEQEPVAGEWIVLSESVGKLKELGWNDDAIHKANTPQRTWVGLTDEDKASFWTADQMTGEEWRRLFAEVEAKLKEKNNG